MSVLLRKEIRLSSLLMTWLFIGFGAMTMIPGYPILCGFFFITLGIYITQRIETFQTERGFIRKKEQRIITECSGYRMIWK